MANDDRSPLLPPALRGRPKSGLGRGLGALLPQRDPNSSSSPRFFECDIDRLRPSAEQPRKTFDAAKLEELVHSIREQGIIQPIVARPEGDDFVIVAGERRWRAARMAGLQVVPVVVKELAGESAFEVALIENIQRDDLNPIEEAEAYHHLLEGTGLTQERLAARVGKDRATLANCVRLLALPEPVRDQVRHGRLAASVGRALLGLRDEEKIVEMARRAEERGLSVRQIEAAVQRETRPEPKPPEAPPEAERLAGKLERLLGFEVELAASSRSGRITLRWAGRQAREALERRVSALLGEPVEVDEVDEN
jgi:ParB family chromosome partitioning protein